MFGSSVSLSLKPRAVSVYQRQMLFTCAGDLIRLYRTASSASAAPQPTKASGSGGGRDTKTTSAAAVDQPMLWATLSIFDTARRHFTQPTNEPDDPNTPILISSDCSRVVAFGAAVDLSLATSIPVVCILTTQV